MGSVAIHRILDLTRLRRRAEGGRVDPCLSSSRLGVARARSLAVVSGKGGTGKSVVSAALARLEARRSRALLLDGDLGVGNAHILQGKSPERSLADVLVGRRPLRDVVVDCGEGLDLVAGGSGVARLASMSGPDLARLGDQLAELETDYAQVVVDCGAGIAESTLTFARAADAVLVVTTPDLTAMTDAYAVLKVLGPPDLARGEAQAMLVVNRARDEHQAAEVAERIDRVARRFLGVGPDWLGWLPDDPAVPESVNAREPVLLHAPDASVSRALHELHAALRERLDARHPRGLGRRLAAGPALSRRLA